MKRILKIMGGLLALVVIVLIIGFVYQTIASQNDQVRYPPPGELVDIGGYRLHINCTGSEQENQPTIILEAGSQSSSADWVRDKLSYLSLSVSALTIEPG